MFTFEAALKTKRRSNDKMGVRDECLKGWWNGPGDRVKAAETLAIKFKKKAKKVLEVLKK